MEESSQPPAPAINPTSDVGFPQPHEPGKGKSKMVKWVIALIGVLLIVGVGGWFILQDVGDQNATPSPTPGTGLSTFPTPTSEATPEETATPAPVSKSDVKIEVLNGTGTPGDAGYLQKQLEGIGFSNITAGNADSQNGTTTTVTFSSDLPAPIVDEVTAKLKSLYSDVSSKKGTLSGGFDIRITTGTKKSASSKASPTPSTSPTATP